jgi:hypothetical protein
VTPADLAEILERIEAKQDWCVSALKHLLALEAGIELPEPEEPDELEEWLAEVPTNGHGEVDMSQFEHVAVRSQPKTKPCPHNQQGVVDGRLKCLRCGYEFTDTGSVQNRVSASGQIVRDPNPPKWATQHSPGASSKNPGSPLVPHSS